MVRDSFELRPMNITGEPVVCLECEELAPREDGKNLVIGSFLNGKLTDLKCAQCRGHIKDAQEVIKEIEWQVISQI